MNEKTATGIDYPTIKLGGVEYTLRFTRGTMLYRLGKAGIKLSDLNAGGTATIAAVIDVLHACLGSQYEGTAEQLSDLVFTDGKLAEARLAIDAALGKVFPTPVAATAPGVTEPKPAVQ